MRKLLNKISDMLTASALAEMGLFEAAKDIVQKYDRHKYLASAEEAFTAITFAEAGEFGTARQLLQESEYRTRVRDLVLPDECQYGDNDICFVQG